MVESLGVKDGQKRPFVGVLLSEVWEGVCEERTQQGVLEAIVILTASDHPGFTSPVLSTPAFRR